MEWLGVLVFDDPTRQGVKAALDDTRKMGIKIKVITGDYKETAEAVASQLGIKPEDVYSRVTPQEKLKNSGTAAAAKENCGHDGRRESMTRRP